MMQAVPYAAPVPGQVVAGRKGSLRGRCDFLCGGEDYPGEEKNQDDGQGGKRRGGMKKRRSIHGPVAPSGR